MERVRSSWIWREQFGHDVFKVDVCPTCFLNSESLILKPSVDDVIASALDVFNCRHKVLVAGDQDCLVIDIVECIMEKLDCNGSVNTLFNRPDEFVGAMRAMSYFFTTTFGGAAYRFCRSPFFDDNLISLEHVHRLEEGVELSVVWAARIDRGVHMCPGVDRIGSDLAQENLREGVLPWNSDGLTGAQFLVVLVPGELQIPEVNKYLDIH